MSNHKTFNNEKNVFLTSQSDDLKRKIHYQPRKLHKNASTTWEIRRKIKKSKKSNVYLAKKYGIHPLTVAKWKKRHSILDIKPHPSPRQKENPLNPLDEALIFFFRKATGLSVDQMMEALKNCLMPHIQRHHIYYCLVKYRINKRQKDAGEPIFAQIIPIMTKDRSISFFMAFHKRKWQGLIHIAGMLTQNLENFKSNRPFDVLELDNSSVLNYYKKKNNLEAFSSPFSLFQLESRLRKTLKYIEQMKDDEDDRENKS